MPDGAVLDLPQAPELQTNTKDSEVLCVKALFSENRNIADALIRLNKTKAKWVPHSVALDGYALEISVLTGFGRLSYLLLSRETIEVALKRGIDPLVTKGELIKERNKRHEEMGKETERGLTAFRDYHGLVQPKLKPGG